MKPTKTVENEVLCELFSIELSLKIWKICCLKKSHIRNPALEPEFKHFTLEIEMLNIFHFNDLLLETICQIKITT